MIWWEGFYSFDLIGGDVSIDLIFCDGFPFCSMWVGIALGIE